MSRINWKITEEDNALVVAIVERALEDSPDELDLDKLDLAMDLTACHLNGCPLRLKELLEADEFNFAHDVFGIRNHIDRTTGKLTGFFEPKCVASLDQLLPYLAKVPADVGLLNDALVAARPLLEQPAAEPAPAQTDQQLNARRYETLRAMHWNDGPLAVVANPKTSVKLGTDCPSGERLDQMLDEIDEQGYPR